MNQIPLRLTMLLISALVCLQASAYDFEVDGLYYDIVSVSDKTCALTNGEPIYSGKINIPDSVLLNGRYLKVIAIKAGTFMDSDEISELTIPKSVINIYGEVFKYGSSIRKLNFSHGDEPLTVGRYQTGPYSSSPWVSSFHNCNPTEVYIDRDISNGFSSHDSVEKVTLGSHLNHFDAGFFNDCKNLKWLYIENSSNPIIFDYNWGQSQFKSCPLTHVYIGRNFQFFHDSRNDMSPFEGNSIEYLALGEQVSILEKESFARCAQLVSVDFPGIEVIGEYSFYECKLLNTPTFPKCVNRIGNNSFYGCKNITEINLDCNAEVIEEAAFGDCDALETININGSTKSIKRSAFGYCENLSSVTLGNEIEFIGNRAFASAAIRDIVFPNSLRDIDEEAFYNCVNLKNITIGNNIKTIGKGAFNSGYAGSMDLDSIKISSMVPPVIYESSFSSKTYLDGVVQVPTKSVDDYKANEEWKNFWNIVGFDFSSSIAPINVPTLKYPIEIFDINGLLHKEPTKGLNIIRYSDGTTEKKFF